MKKMNEIEMVFPNNVEKYAGLQCNKRNDFYMMPEIKIIKHHLIGLSPKVALDVGAGIGRVSVFFFKQFNWVNTQFILADGNSGKKQLHGMRKGKTDFYNSLSATKSFCKANGMLNYEVFNLEKYMWAELEHRPDLVYSFKALGFHWPINLFLDDIHPKLGDKCLLIFGLRGGKKAMGWIYRQVVAIDREKYRTIDAFISPIRSIGYIALEKN